MEKAFKQQELDAKLQMHQMLKQQESDERFQMVKEKTWMGKRVKVQME